MSGRELGQALCEALGVDPARVIKIVLTVEVNEVPTLDITELAIPLNDSLDGDALIEVISNYRLEPKCLATD